MTAKKPKAEHKKPMKRVTPTRKPGFLVCDECKRAVPYQGMESSDLAMDDWPQHRCGLDIRPFDRWQVEDPKAESRKIVLGYWHLDKSPLEEGL